VELELIKKIKKLADTQKKDSCRKQVVRSIGDDCAVVIPGDDKELLITTDTLCEQVHFKLSYFPPFRLGSKLASVNLSDIAAMGGRPKWALLNLEVPPGLANAKAPFWTAFFKGLNQRLSRFGAVLVGGDTVSAPQDRLSLTLTLIGEVERGKAVYRSGASSGDLIYCSGYTGEAACGLRLLEDLPSPCPLPRQVRKRLLLKHLDPEPRNRLGTALREAGINSLIDVSDGIASDLAHICEESRLMAVVNQRMLPVSRALKTFCKACEKRKGKILHTALAEYVLFGGEDFELIWTVSPERSQIAEQAALSVMGFKPFLIGRMEKGSGCFLDTGRNLIDISFKGYEH